VTQRRIVTVGLLGFIAIHAAETLFKKEHWPFCSYPMYSWVEQADRGVTSFRVSGVTASGEEVRLQAPELLYPFDQSRIADAFAGMHTRSDSTARARTALAGVLATYERRRSEGLHSGPALRGMRLYRTVHQLDPQARNLLTPERRDLLAEAGVTR
jgi:hypothetical protein